jgi:hypothetical protein
MKKLIIGIIIGISCTALIGAGIENYVASKKTAEVNRVMGLYVFTDSNPVMDYEKLGSVKVGTALALSDEYGAMRDALIKKAKKEYPNADAILCYPEVKGLDAVTADVIKFK